MLWQTSQESPLPQWNLLTNAYVMIYWRLEYILNNFSLKPSILAMFFSTQFSSVAQSCPTLCNLMNRSTPGLPVHHRLLEFTQTHVIESVMPSNHLILCHPLLLLPPIFPSINKYKIAMKQLICLAKVKVKVAQLCLTLFDPMDYTVHGIFQARILEWVAFPFSMMRTHLKRPWRWERLKAGGEGDDRG